MADRKKSPKGSPAPPVPAQEGLFLTIGVPRGPAARMAMEIAVKTLKRNGFRAAVTSDDAILAAAEILKAKDDQGDDQP